MERGSQGCEHEPNWRWIYPNIAKPDDSLEEKQQCVAKLLKMDLKCKKLQINPSACHKCKDNPLKQASAEQNMNYRLYSGLIEIVARLLDGMEFGLVEPSTITETEFELLRIYRAATKRVF